MRDVNNGWLIRYLHSNTASAFFFIVYLHIGRGLYYGSYKAPRTLVWTIGTVIFILMMGTAFLGYNNSPKWSKLNLIFYINNFLIENSHYVINLFLVLFVVSFILFYLHDFKLLSLYYIKYFQLFSFIGLFLAIIICISNIANYIEVVCCVNEKDSVNLHGHTNITKDAAISINQGMSTTGSNLGLGATMAGVSTAVAKGIVKFSLPTVQKAGVIIGGALVAGFGHSIITTVNKNNISLQHVSNSNLGNNIYSNISKLVDDSLSSPLQTLLFDIKGLNITCLSLIIILAIQIFFKFYIKDNINLNLSHILGVNLKNKLEYYFNKIIILNKKMSNLYIWLRILILIFGFYFSIYATQELLINLDNYTAVHSNIKRVSKLTTNKNKHKLIMSKNITINININKNKFNISQYSCFQKRHSSTFCKNNLLKEFLKEKKVKPTHLYENLQLDETRKIILKDTKDLSGIYLIFNKITGDYYVGSASTNRLYSRFSNHLLYFRGSKILKHAVKKYSISNFAFLILELFQEIVNKENNKKLLDVEDFYLKSLLPNYNILTEAGSSFGYKHTELNRIKMKTNYSSEQRELIGGLNKGKNLSKITKEKMREKALIRKKIPFSVKALLNLKKNSKAIILYNLDRTVFGEYSSIVEAARSINCVAKTIRRALNTEKKILKRRFIVKYIYI